MYNTLDYLVMIDRYAICLIFVLIIITSSMGCSLDYMYELNNIKYFSIISTHVLMMWADGSFWHHDLFGADFYITILLFSFYQFMPIIVKTALIKWRKVKMLKYIFYLILSTHYCFPYFFSIMVCMYLRVHKINVSGALVMLMKSYYI